MPRAVLALLAALASATSCTAGQASPTAAPERTLRVFVAASLTDAMAEMSDAFARQHSERGVVQVELNVAGSATLREQIFAGAPGDVFVSANQQIMDEVVTAGETAGTAQTLAVNSMALITPPGNPGGVTGLADLDRHELLIGLCAPGVPCGDFAAKMLKQAGIEPSADTFEDDVRSLLTRVIADELDVAIVYQSDVVAAGDSVTSITIDDNSNLQTLTTIAVLQASPNPDLAELFINYSKSREGRQILERHGLDTANP